MKTYTQEEIDQVLNDHFKWLYGRGGSRSNLLGANLNGVDLSGANICGLVGNKKNIKSIFIEKYDICYTSKIMQIGCEKHSIKEWFDFDNKAISSMDSGALMWWNKWKPIIKNIIEISPCEPTK